eukprot:TRINITY_DN1255_c0_g2_i2.p1 TRINITY_DN1255_c0_g2~~TRINITY_DN1255_c0_g2_i2.p1  ORF type:complete len:1840 (-),score=597.38 TRINITY_DN1255_c0_g2_i2:454-5973(-)
MGDVSEPKIKNERRPCLETEAISGDEETAEAYEEVKLDYSMLSKDVLNPPTIPKSLGHETIDQVIAALTNVPDVKIEGEPRKKPPSLPPPHASIAGPGGDIIRRSGKRSSSPHHSSRRGDSGDRSSDDGDDYRSSSSRRSSKHHRRDSYHEDDYHRGGGGASGADPFVKRISVAAFRGRSSRGRLRIRARGRGRGFLLEQARGLFAPRVARAKLISREREYNQEYRGGGRGGGGPSERGGYHADRGGGRGRGDFGVARGRNIFPEDEPGFGGRGMPRENALYKRFKQQHRFEDEKDDEIYYEGTTKRSRSRTRSSTSRSNSSSGGSTTSDSDSDDSPRKKKKKKDKKKKSKKSKREKKKKKIKEESEDEKDSDWRIQMLQKMKSIKNLPPEELEVEFKKAMAEKKRKEEEEKCVELIKERQRLARKVKKESEKAQKKAAKDESKKKRDSEENFYAGFNEAALKMEEADAPASRPASEEQEDAPTTYPAIFKPSFAEIPFTEQVGDPMETPAPEGYGELPPADDSTFIPRASQVKVEEDDPYARAFEENMARTRKSEPKDDVSWPAGALEESGIEDTQLTKEQMDLLQDQQRQVMDDKAKTVVSASKMFSKIRNRIKSKPLKINLKMHSKTDEQGLEAGGTGENTPGEGMSDEEEQEPQEYSMLNENDDINLTKRMERMRRKKEMPDPGELEDGEHSPSPEPVRPHLRRKRLKPGTRGGTPLMDEKVPVEEREEGEIDPDTPQSAGVSTTQSSSTAGGGVPAISTTSWPPPPQGTLVPPPAPIGAAAASLIDTSVPPPNLIAGGVPPPVVGGSPYGPPPYASGGSVGPPDFNAPPPHGVVYPPPIRHGAGGPPPNFTGPPPVGIPPPGMYPSRPGVPPPHMPPHARGIPPLMGAAVPRPSNVVQQPPVSDPFVSSSKDAYHGPPSRRSAEHDMYSSSSGRRSYEDRRDHHDRYNDGRYDRQDRYGDRHDDRRDKYDDRRDKYDERDRSSSSRRSREDRDYDRDHQQQRHHHKRRSSRERKNYDVPTQPSRHAAPDTMNKVYGGEDISDTEEGFDDANDRSADGGGGIDITKITPIMKYIAKHLEEKRHTLELRGPFKFNDNMPGLSKHLFVSYKIVEILEKAGFDQSKMYMQQMFPNGLNKTKADMLDMAGKEKLHPEVHGPKMIKMVSRCIKCFIAYYSGKKDDLASSSEEEGDGGKETRMVSTSLSAVLGRIKENVTEEMSQNKQREIGPTGAERPLANIPDTISNPWNTMDTKQKVEKLKSFSLLQNHFTKQLMGKGVDARDAREESADCMMCLVVSGWSDDMLKEMVSRSKKVILPEQSALEEKRTGPNRTLFDQMVDLMLRHKQAFPTAILEASQREEDPTEAMLKRVRNIIERMLKFYMKACGKVQEGRDPSAAQPAAPSDYQYNYLPEGLREDEKSGEGGSGVGGGKDPLAAKNPNNFFNMDAAAVANRSFSTYSHTKRISLDDDEPDIDLEPVSPDNGEIIKGVLPKQKYLLGSLTVDTLQFKGVSYLYEMNVHMSDTSSLELFVVPTNLRQDKTVLEMLGFSHNPEDNKFLYVKPGHGMNRVYGELQALEKLIQFLKEKRYESKGDSKNTGLVLVTQTTGELATWEKFIRFYKQDTEIDSLVAGYGVLDYFVEDSGGLYSYVGPKMNREPDKTFFTWEFNSQGRMSENMTSSRASAVLNLLEDLLGSAPTYDNFIKENCFRSGDEKMINVQRKENIIQDLYTLECHLCDKLNDRAHRKKIYTGGIFSPSTMADWGDKAGAVAAKFVRFLVESGLSRPALRDRTVLAREKGISLQINLEAFIRRMRKDEERDRCSQQIETLIKVTEEFMLSK